VFAPECVVVAEADASLEVIGASNGVADVVGLWFENGQVDTVGVGEFVDVCPANGVNDIDGQSRPPVDDVTARSAFAANVERQQTKLNELFAGSGIADLDVDGVSGPRTGQRLCAARLALGLATTIADMAPGSNEQAVLFEATGLPTPSSSATASERWVLIDRTCQIMFVGAGAETQFIFPTSTGSEGFETRIQDRAEAFRFNPALDNGGWHDSSEYPVGVDNPLNGNLYKPLYFDLGQAIHGANNVPPTPASKGCARLSVADQNTFIAWLGLDTATGETWRKSEMNVTVNVQGDFVARNQR
jgi:lipoprotein-anchoring transpeptidase ErfK/SrfK